MPWRWLALLCCSGWRWQACAPCSRRTAANPHPLSPSRNRNLAGAAVGLLPALPTSGPVLTPTPDSPHVLPRIRTQVEQYTVQVGDTLASIAQRYTVSIPQILQANGLSDPNYVEVGQVLSIPLPDPANSGPGFKIIPDSELVYSPSNAGFVPPGRLQLSTATWQITRKRLCRD